jgi:hypothetical protein
MTETGQNTCLQKNTRKYFTFIKQMSAVARKYCIMQVGITFFVPVENSKNVTAHPFNFYIFPRPTMYGDPTISMQSGCVSFNIANKMDWSRWIEKGTYLIQFRNNLHETYRIRKDFINFGEGQKIRGAFKLYGGRKSSFRQRYNLRN